MSWATPDDIIDRWVGPGAPSDEALVQRWIDDAEVIIRNEVPDIDERLADLDIAPDEATVVFVVAQMVMRALGNPRRVRQEGVGPYNTTYAGDNPGSLWMDDDELAMLRGESARGRQRAYTINSTPAMTRPEPDPWG